MTVQAVPQHSQYCFKPFCTLKYIYLPQREKKMNMFLDLTLLFLKRKLTEKYIGIF